MAKEKHTAARGTSKKKTIVTPDVVEPMAEVLAANEPTSVAMTPVTVNGWQLFTSAADHWILDIYLAQKAEQKKPRNIRATIGRVIADGGVRVIGDAAAELCASLGVTADGVKLVGAEYAVRSSAKTGKRSSRVAKSTGDSGARSTGATIRAEYEVIPKGNRGGTQRVICFYLDRKASLLTIMKLRTPKAVELQGAVCDVFFAAMDGTLARGATLDERAILVAIEELRAEIALYKQAGLAPRGFIGPDGAARIAKREADVVAATNMNHGDLDQALRGILQFGGTGTEWALLSPEKEVTLMIVCSVFEQVMASVKTRSKASKGFDVKLRIKGRGAMPEQLVLAITTFLATPR